MKQPLVKLVTAVVVFGLLATTSYAETKELWSLSGFSHPESVDLDVAHQVFYVSNIDGAPLDKDGNGFISKVSRDGKLIDLKWVTGLNAPKGMVSQGYNLYVTDIDRLVKIDTRTGKIIAAYPAEGAKFLNDPAIDARGNVYVTDTANKTIWQLHNSRMSIWYQGKDMMHPNGLRVIDGNRLLVAGWGYEMQEDGTVKTPGHLFTINLKTKKLKNLGDGRPVGTLDGLERDAHGNFLTTDYNDGTLFRIHKNGSYETLLDLTTGSADLDVIDKGHTAVIPMMMEDKIIAYHID